jgi:SH3-like domain-containing protein
MRPFTSRFTLASIAIGLATLGTIVTSSLPAIARPATLTTEDANGRVNVRSAASVKSSVLETLKTGGGIEVLNIVQVKGDYWYYVRSDIEGTAEGWVNSNFVRFKSSDQRFATLKGSRDERINVRSGPTTNSRATHYGLSGDLVSVGRLVRGDEGERWYYVTFPNQSSGWVRSDLLSIWPKGCIITCPDV